MKKPLCISVLTLQLFVLEALNVAEMKEYIQKKFKTTDKKNCGAAVTLFDIDTAIPIGSAQQDVACLLTSQRGVIWRSIKELEEACKEGTISQYDLDLMKTLIKEEGISEYLGYMYRPEAKKSALLLAKEHIEHKDQPMNHYLKGLLLGYSEPNIEFFSQRNAFRKTIGPSAEVPAQYPRFSEELKQQFETFKKEVWPGSEAHKSFEKSKRETYEWLKENETRSISKLQKWIEEKKSKGPCRHGVQR